MEQDINQWAAGSIADITDSVTNLGDEEQTEVRLATFQVRAGWTVCMKQCVNDCGGVVFKVTS